MEVKWKRGFDKSDVTENNSISLAQFDYMVRFQEEYIEEIAAGQNMTYDSFSDVGEIRVYFASKILTPCRMH